MIVVKLMGGLGNQMFEYAAGKALSQMHEVPLFVDTSFLETDPAGKYTKRDLELQALNVWLSKASEAQLRSFQPKNFIARLFSAKTQATVLHDNGRFDPAFFETTDKVYLNGYWQSERYFKQIRALLLQEFTPRYEFNAEEQALISRVKNCQSVAIHVRRSDYVNHKEASAFHGVCGMDYYNAAVAFVQNKISDPQFFIFSDDLTWCRDHFKHLPNAAFVDLKSSQASADLFLMSYCRHNIIANSSYSWWAAWLNRHEDKIVCAPKKWFSKPDLNPDIYCNDWNAL